MNAADLGMTIPAVWPPAPSGPQHTLPRSGGPSRLRVGDGVGGDLLDPVGSDRAARNDSCPARLGTGAMWNPLQRPATPFDAWPCTVARRSASRPLWSTTC